MPVPNVAESLPPESDQPFNIGEADDSLPRMCALFEQFGDTYRVYSPLRKASVWVINHPDDVKRVLVSNHRNYTKGLGFDRVRILLGTGLIASEGEFWRRQRYLMQPSFHRRVLTRFAEVISAANERRLARWQALAGAGELVNVTDETSEMTLEIVLETIFGSDVARITAELGHNPFAIVTQEPARDLKFAYRFRSLGKVVAAMLAHRRANPAEHFDYLAMLQDARDKDSGDAMSDRELIDEVLTLIVAGHETTASALNSTWYLLARNPEAERKLHQELDAAPQWGMLFHLQQLGARPGDHLILLLNNNEQFIDAFWGAILGGIVPVPVAIGISDEHRRKLLRIAQKLGQPFIFSDRKTLERMGQFVQQAGDAGLTTTFAALRPRAFVTEDVADLSKARLGARGAPGRHGLHPVLLRLHQRTEGRGADARQPDGPQPSP
jgi:cytochrome P450